MARKFLGTLSVHVFEPEPGRIEVEQLAMIPPSNGETFARILEAIAEKLRAASSPIQVVKSTNGILQ